MNFQYLFSLVDVLAISMSPNASLSFVSLNLSRISSPCAHIYVKARTHRFGLLMWHIIQVLILCHKYTKDVNKHV